MPVVDRSPRLSAPPYEQGWPYLVDFGAGDAVTVRPSLRVSGGRVSFGWTLTVGAGASIVRQVSMQWPSPVWATPLSPALVPEDPFTADYLDSEDAPFAALRFTQAGGAASTLSILSRWPLEVG